MILTTVEQCVAAMCKADKRLSEKGAMARIDAAIQRNVTQGMKRQKAINVAITNIMMALQQEEDEVEQIDLVKMEAMARQLMAENPAMSPRKARKVAELRLRAQMASGDERQPQAVNGD